MKKNVLSKPGDWSLWTEEMKTQATQAESNTQVGERVVYENDEFRVWSIHLPAGQKLPFHKHQNRYFWTAMSAGKSRSFYHDGSVSETDYEIGDTSWFPDLNPKNYFIHNLENIGETMLIFTTVEFLK